MICECGFKFSEPGEFRNCEVLITKDGKSIIVCPKCKTPKGITLSSQTTKCIKCDKVLNLKKIKIVFKTNSENELRNVIGLINAEKDGNLDKFKKIMAQQKI